MSEAGGMDGGEERRVWIPESTEERGLLEHYLERARKLTVHRVEGLAVELWDERVGKSKGSVMSVIRHLTYLEQWWFQGVMAQLKHGDTEPEDYDLGPEDTVAMVRHNHRRACEISCEIFDRFDMDDQSLGRDENYEHRTLRWICLRMISERVRSNGRLDVYRDLLDGRVDEPPLF